MSLSFASPLSGLRAAQMRLASTASTIAHRSGVGALPAPAAAPASGSASQAMAAEQAAQVGGGTATPLRTASPGFMAALLPQADATGGGDLAGDMLDLATARTDFLANAAVYRVTDEMLRSLYELTDEAP